MNRRRILVVAAAGLCAAVWTYACGDGATEPPTPPPDPPRPATVAVAPAAVRLTELGATEQLTAEVRDQNGNAMAGAAVSWVSSAASVATVSAAGLVTAAGSGTATITATAGSASGSATVTVAQGVSAVAVSPAADTLVAGDTLRLAAEAADANGHTVAGAEFTWASSDTLVAVVDDAGLVTGHGAGEAEVTATAAGVTGRVELTVVAPAPTAITVTPDTVALTALGQTAQLAAVVRDQIGRVIEGEAVFWSSADTLVATVDSAGLVTAIGEGATTVAATVGEVSGTAAVTVMQSAGSVVVSPAADTVAPGDTLRLAAQAFDENGHPVEGAEFGWSSSDVSVATVDVGGLVTGVAEGTATIVAAAGSGRGTAMVTVENPDRAALVALYNATDGPNWVANENWLTDAALGEWYGVTTDDSGRVVRLDLSGREAQGDIPHGLAGPIPPQLGSLTNLTLLDLKLNALSGSIPAELGNLANLARLDLSENNLTGPIPPELGNLANLSWADLRRNALTGTLPPELGNLVNLARLDLRENNLTGPVPQSFLLLRRLRDFRIDGNKSLCVPGTSAFVAWLQGLFEGACNAADIAVLETLYELTGGTAWNESAGWLGNGAVEEWYGVTADSLGRVTELDLTRNGLAGRLPESLAALAHMTEFRIAGNAELSGRLPLSLAQLDLREFHYAGTDLCVPPEASFRTWLDAISSHQGTGVECAPLSDREIVEILYEATGGRDWTNNQNWLTDAPLRDWYGVRVDNQGRVTALDLDANDLVGPIVPELGSLTNLTRLDLRLNGLTGTIPPTLGNLASLEFLRLNGNELTGPIPPELGNLSSLEFLRLNGNELTGPIPPELGNLSSLEYLRLNGNKLTGPIPPTLGNLASLEYLRLNGNQLTGPIPPGLGNLSNLQRLYLSENSLTGAIPPGLGNLSNLQELYLSGNSLTGAIPPGLGNLGRVTYLALDGNDLSGPLPGALGGMASLQELYLTGNSKMEGALPKDLTALHALEALVAGGTGLCVPSDPDFQAWLEGVHKRRITPCAEGISPMAYLTQAVQSREFPVPLVAGEEALLRVFPTARQATSEGIPLVRARFHVDGREAHVAEISGKSTPIPTDVDEGSLSASANAEIPGEVIQPGLEMVIEIDPSGTLDQSLGVAKRIPATGRLAVDVRTMPLFDLTLVPLIWTDTQDSSVVNLVLAIAADPENHEMLWDTRTLLPVSDLAVAVHEPVQTSTNHIGSLLSEMSAIRSMDGATGYYMGMIAPPVAGAAGLAAQSGRLSVSVPYPDVIAHELGHNLSLPHAPCGDAMEPDPGYPYPDGSIGAWGYDFRNGGALVHASTPDLMSYCSPQWISDYNFTNALRYRLFDEGVSSVAATPATKSLLLWGGIGADTIPFLEPAFVVNAPPALPDSAGEYQVVGRTSDGGQLFSLSFTMPEVADGDGSSSFAFVLPVRSGWEEHLARITLTGPGGAFTLDGESDIPMAILRNPSTRQVRAILRDPPPATQAAADASATGAPGLEILFSRGIPGVDAWRR